MKRRPALLLTLLVAPIVVAACGASTTPSASRANGTGTTVSHETTTTLAPDGMTAEEMKHMRRALVPSREIPVLANGTLDPNRINLGGTPGVTPAEQVQAQNLLRETIDVLPGWDNTATAAADGY